MYQIGTYIMYVPICNRFHATRANHGKTATFCWGMVEVPVFDACVRRPP